MRQKGRPSKRIGLNTEKKPGEKHGAPTDIIPQLRERKNEKTQKKYRKGIDYLETIGYNHSNKTAKAQKENRKGKQQ